MQYDPNRNGNGWNNGPGYGGNQQPANPQQPYAAYQQNAYQQGQQTGGQPQQSMGQQGQVNQAYNGYGQPPVYNGYGYQQQPQQIGGYYHPYPQQGYQQNGNPYAQGYGQQNGYQAYPPQGYQNGYQQNPYAQQNGYPPQNGFANGPYAQQSQQTEPQKQGRSNGHSLLTGPILYGCVGAVLIVLFALAMVFSATPLRWIFAALAVIAVGCLWLLKSSLGRGTKLTVTVILAALTVVAVASGLARPGQDRQQTNGTQGNGVPAAQVQTTEDVAPVLESTPAPETDVLAAANNSDPLNSDAVEQVKNFYYFWSVNNYDNIVALCPPSWVRSQSNASQSIFQLIGNRNPVDFTVTAITGTENDTSRTVTVEATIDRHLSSNSIQKYMQKIVVLKEDGVWYVDPRSLESHEATPSPSPQNSLPTQPPQPASNADPSTKLYYNPDGGTLYHLDQNCKNANQKYLPFKGVFTYGELNNAPYSSLEPCAICSAPLRPET